SRKQGEPGRNRNFKNHDNKRDLEKGYEVITFITDVYDLKHKGLQSNHCPLEGLCPWLVDEPLFHTRLDNCSSAEFGARTLRDFLSLHHPSRPWKVLTPRDLPFFNKNAVLFTCNGMPFHQVRIVRNLKGSFEGPRVRLIRYEDASVEVDMTAGLGLKVVAEDG
ncbi:hypothetical protein ACH5RR_036835, partial [Cinchona calisaya]